jgi:hypothetical protein
MRPFAAMAKKTPKKRSKTDYVLAHPKLTASEVVAKAKSEGIKISSQLVYVVRGRAKKNGNAPRRGPGRPPKSSPAKAPKRKGRPSKRPQGPVGPPGNPHNALIDAVFALGLDALENMIARRLMAMR